MIKGGKGVLDKEKNMFEGNTARISKGVHILRRKLNCMRSSEGGEW